MVLSEAVWANLIFVHSDGDFCSAAKNLKSESSSVYEKIKISTFIDIHL